MRTSAASSHARGTPRSSAARVARPRRPDERLLQPAARHSARPALPGRPARGSQARALHRGRDLRRRRRPSAGIGDVSSAGSASSSLRRTGTLCTCPRAAPTAFSHSTTTPRSPTRCLPRTSPKPHGGCGSTTPRSRSPGRSEIVGNQRARSLVRGLRIDGGRIVSNVELQPISVDGAASACTRFATELFPICRSITGDGVRETLRRIGERHSARGARGAERHPGPRLDRAGRVEHPRRVHRRARRPAGGRLPGVEPPRRRLQRAGSARR